MKIFKKLLFLLDAKERKSAFLLLILILNMAFLDALGVASILPFMTVITNPDIIDTNLYLNKAFEYSKLFGVETKQDFLFASGIIVFLLFVTSLIFKGLTIYFQTRFAVMRNYSISSRLMESYLRQPYSFFLRRHSAELGKNILTEVNKVVGAGIKPLIELITKTIVTLAIIALLIFANPKLTIIIGLTLILSYSLIYKILSIYIIKIGKKNFNNNQLQFLAINEAFNAIKEIKLGQFEKVYLKQFTKPARTIAEDQSILACIGMMPRFALELMAFGGILLIIIYIIGETNSSLSDIIPLLSLYVFAAYRLMPAMQNIYGSITKLTFVHESLEALVNDFKNLKIKSQIIPSEDITFKKSIILKDVHFQYEKTSKSLIKNINLEIPCNTTVGIIGPTGSGKTTLVDLILGLLEIKKGTLEIDGKIITNRNLLSWQKFIGYVPQNIYLSDDTVAANIAFGVKSENINFQMIKQAAKIANLDDFVEENLPEKYQTTIGERGVRLSGGQIQRIGIARALYTQPKLLIFDEATSALDVDTEKLVMEAVNNIRNKVTVILIAHRLDTVKECDIVYKLDQGRIIKKGKPHQIINFN
jgi:ABC-type multidrug transport system fused ATPase/permease subunit